MMRGASGGATALEVLNAERFVDQAPPAIYATLLDERDLPLLGTHPVPHPGPGGRVRERRNARRHPDDHKAEFLTTDPHPLWTSPKEPQTWTYFYL